MHCNKITCKSRQNRQGKSWSLIQKTDSDSDSGPKPGLPEGDSTSDSTLSVQHKLLDLAYRKFGLTSSL